VAVSVEGEARPQTPISRFDRDQRETFLYLVFSAERGTSSANVMVRPYPPLPAIEAGKDTKIESAQRSRRSCNEGVVSKVLKFGVEMEATIYRLILMAVFIGIVVWAF
jgi:hypothetical protein